MEQNNFVKKVNKKQPLKIEWRILLCSLTIFFITIPITIIIPFFTKLSHLTLPLGYVLGYAGSVTAFFVLLFSTNYTTLTLNKYAPITFFILRILIYTLFIIISVLFENVFNIFATLLGLILNAIATYLITIINKKT
ncbi:MG406 family protein [Spiroplasma endosymbiont of Anurida maritima]|uniref:MG406 family protein n=1 Tax=Spiroplasma endosymbiont of Anurida maritima TaxID=2967972 RepID=UPI0036D3EB03